MLSILVTKITYKIINKLLNDEADEIDYDRVEETNQLINNTSESYTKLGILYSVLGGVSSSFTLFLTNIALNSIEIINDLHIIFILIIITLLCVSVYLQLFALNRALQFYCSTKVIPIFYTTYTCLSVLDNFVYKRIGNHITQISSETKVYYLFLILLGLGMIFFGIYKFIKGVYFLSSKQIKQEENSLID